MRIKQVLFFVVIIMQSHGCYSINEDYLRMLEIQYENTSKYKIQLDLAYKMMKCFTETGSDLTRPAEECKSLISNWKEALKDAQSTQEAQDYLKALDDLAKAHSTS